MSELKKRVCLFMGGGVGYSLLEIAWRGHTHWSMALTGGACLTGMYLLHRRLRTQPLWLQALAGAGLVTAAEFTVGCIVNLWLSWRIWDYSHFRIQLLGQVCLVFSLLWYLLSLGVFGCFVLAERRAPSQTTHIRLFHQK